MILFTFKLSTFFCRYCEHFWVNLNTDAMWFAIFWLAHQPILNSCLFRLNMDDLLLASRGFFMKWSFLNAFLARLLAMILPDETWWFGIRGVSEDQRQVGIWFGMRWNEMDSWFLQITSNYSSFFSHQPVFGLEFQMVNARKGWSKLEACLGQFPVVEMGASGKKDIFQGELDCNL